MHTHIHYKHTHVHTHIHAHMHSYTHTYTNEHASPIPSLITNIWNFGQFFLILTFTAKKIRESVSKQRYIQSISSTWKPQNILTCYANTQEHTQRHRGMRIQVWLLTPEGVWILLNDVEDMAKFRKLSRAGHYSYPWTLRDSVTPNHYFPSHLLPTSFKPSKPPQVPTSSSLSQESVT